MTKSVSPTITSRKTRGKHRFLLHFTDLHKIVEAPKSIWIFAFVDVN